MATTCNLDCDKELNVIFKGTTPIFNFNVCLDTSLVDVENTHNPVTSVNGQTGAVKTVKVVVSSAAPDNMNDGDLWYKILT